MNYYDPAQPRFAIGLAAVIMSAITISVLVILPSKMEPESQAFSQLAALSSFTVNPCAPARLKCVDLAALRDTTSPALQNVATSAKCKELG
jgi:hypothetical protein